MSLTSEVVYKSNGVRVASEATSMQLEGPATVKLGVDPQSVLRFERAGDDLVLVLKDGRKLTVSDFFAVDAQGQGSDLVLQGQDGVSWLGERTGAGADFHFTQLPAEAVPVAAAGGAGGSSMPWVLAGLGGAGALALAGGGGGGGGGDDSPSPPAPAVNNPPTATAQALSLAEDTLGSGRITASDPDGNTLTYRVATGPTQGSVTVDAGTGAYNYTPKANYHGEDSFAIAVEDGRGGSTTVTVQVTVNPVNDAPYGMETNHTGLEDLPFSASVDTNDPDGDTLVYSLATGPEHGIVVVNADGTYVYTPAANYHGTDTFTLRADDGHGGTSMNKVTITLAPANDAPVFTALAPTTAEDTLLTGTIAAVDVDGDAMLYTLAVAPPHGTLTLDQATGAYTYKPASNFHGTVSFQVTADDGHGGVQSLTVPITVTPVNDVPVVTPRGLGLSEDIGGTGNIRVWDADGDPITYTLHTAPVHGAVVVNADGSYFYTPARDFYGEDAFTLKVDDGNGGVVLATIPVKVTPVNDPPVVGSTYITVSTAEDTPLNGVIVASDVDGDALLYAIPGPPANGTVTIDSATGAYVYTPDPDMYGVDSFQVRISDGNNGSEWVTVVVNVTPVNDAPVFPDVEVTAAEDTSLGSSVVGYDIDGDDLSYRVTAGPAHGTVVMNPANGTYTYTPDAGYYGADAFEVTADDGNGGMGSGVVTVNVTPVNDTPVADDVTLATSENTPVNGTVPATDADGDALSFTIVGAPVHGTVVLNTATGTFTYTPGTGYSGNDSFVVSVRDGNGGAVGSTVTIGISPINDAPVASDDTVTTDQGSAVTVAVRANDTDADGDLLVVTGVTQGANGSVVIDSIYGNPVYTPDIGFNGVDQFTYTVSDQHGGTATATVSVTVTPVSIAPEVASESIRVAEGGTATTLFGTGADSVLDNDTDANGDPLTAVLVSGPTHGTLVLDPDGTFTYIHDGSEISTDAFTYKANDGTFDSNTITVIIGVTPVNDPPVAVADAYAVDQDGVLSVTASNGLLANDMDIEVGALTATLTSAPLHGSILLNSDGSFSYVPDAGFAGVDSFTYVAHDGTASGNAAAVTVTVAPPAAPMSAMVLDFDAFGRDDAGMGDAPTTPPLPAMDALLSGATHDGGVFASSEAPAWSSAASYGTHTQAVQAYAPPAAFDALDHASQHMQV